MGSLMHNIHLISQVFMLRNVICIDGNKPGFQYAYSPRCEKPVTKDFANQGCHGLLSMGLHGIAGHFGGPERTLPKLDDVFHTRPVAVIRLGRAENPARFPLAPWRKHATILVGVNFLQSALP